MSSFDLQIRFDRPDGVYRPGESVTGQVHVGSDRDGQASEVRLELGWRTHSWGDVDGQSREVAVLGPVRWRAGEAASVRFEFPAPTAPLSHQGQTVSVLWTLKALARVPWASEPTVEQPLWLSAPAGSGLGLRVDDARTAALASWSRYTVVGALAFGILLMTYCIYTAITTFEGNGVVQVATVLAALLIFVAVVVAWLPWRFGEEIGELLVGEMEMEVRPEETPQTGAMPVRVALKGARARVRRVTAALVVREWTERADRITDIDQGGKPPRVHELSREERVLALPHGSMGRGSAYEGALPLPQIPHLPYSFRGSFNRHEWLVEIQVDFLRGPKFTRTVMLTAFPAGHG